MPLLIVTDLEFPQPRDAAFARFEANRCEIQELVRNCSNLQVVFEDEVDAGSLRWRLFQSVAAPVRELSVGDIKLILLEHVWPTFWMRDRDTFHSRIMQSLVGSFTDAFIVTIGRPATIRRAHNFQAGRKRITVNC